MSIYSHVESGSSFHRSRFSKSISYTKKYDCQFGRLIPVLEKFVLPGDVWRIGGDVLVRFQPQLAPSLTASIFRVRYFFVPLRLIEPNAELVITGSKDGHLYSGELPVLDNLFSKVNKTQYSNAYKILKHSLFDYYGCQVGDYEQIKNEKFLPAAYWNKAYYRIIWDFYTDENISNFHSSFDDFDTLYATIEKQGGQRLPESCSIPKDYFSSSLPWQLKGVTPALDINASATFTPNYVGTNFVDAYNLDEEAAGHHDEATRQIFGNPDLDGTSPASESPFAINREVGETNIQAAYEAGYINSQFITKLAKQQTVNLTGLSFNADELRTMMAQTRIFERLARCGSRYTEYLRSNFGTAPADDTLQRAQYLGGWKLPIVTTEVLQTAEDGTTPVGTMRGHAITRGGNKIDTFFAKEFGVIIGIAHILPKIEYTTGCPREMSYKERFDFFNPSLQHLSDQE